MKTNASTKHQYRSKVSIELTAQDFYQHHRNHFWYVGVGLLILVAAYVTIVIHDYLLLAAVLACGMAVFRLANLKPQTRSIKLTNNGVYWGERFFGYHQLRAFWVAQVQGRVTVYLERLNLNAPISFVASREEAEKVVTHLAQHLPWHDHRSEPISEKLGRFLQL